jgi:O-antigen biosynthesis protein
MSKKVLIIGKIWPEPVSSAAGARMLQIIRGLVSQKCDVIFASVAKQNEFSHDLSHHGVSAHTIELNSSSFDSFLSEHHPDIVIFDRFTSEEQFGWRVAAVCPDAIRILNTEDLHGLRQGRQQAVSEGRSFENRDLLNDTSRREIASIYRCDLSLIISEFEMHLLHDFFKVDDRLLFYLPLTADNIFDAKTIPSFDERKDFISIGNFLHAPNADAVEYLRTVIWPRIHKEAPGTRLLVYGAYISTAVTKEHDPANGFYIMGRAESAYSVLKQARVCIAPLRFGAGLKGKLLDAMVCGTPNVTTGIGAEGMHFGLPWSGFICDDENAFVSRAVELYTNSSLWREKQNNGTRIIEQHFSDDRSRELISRADQIRNDLSAHREANFTGSMLMQNQQQSTKYMSLWIEEKNRNKLQVKELKN